MKIKLTSVSIADYDKALHFYTNILANHRRHFG
jgi:catechol 2,3-dioxygenase-like lactoylglutathione lyase family enzyme